MAEGVRRGLRSRRFFPWIALFLIVGTVFAIRLVMLSSYAAPPGADAGNYLTILHAFCGNDVSGLDLAHSTPPIYYVLFLGPLVKLFPAFVALKVSKALVPALLAIPFFFLTRRIIKNDAISLLTAGLFAFSPPFSQMLSWGGDPNLLGIFFMLWSGYFLLRAIEQGSKRDAILCGLFLSLTVGTHLITAAFYVLALLLLGLGLLLWIRKEASPRIKLLLLAGASGALLSLPYLWTTYLAIFSEGYLFPKFGAVNVPTAVSYSLFIVIPVLVAVFIWIWMKSKDKFIPLFILSLTLSSLILAFAYPAGASRLVYFLYIPFFLILGIILQYLASGMVRARINGRLGYVALFLIPLIAIPGLLIADSYAVFKRGIEWHQELNDNTIEALDWITVHTGRGDVVLPNDYYLAWWIEGYAERRSLMPQPAATARYISEAEYEQIELANKMIAGNYIVDNGYVRVADFFPGPSANPRIFLHPGAANQELLFFDDSDAIWDGEKLSSAPGKVMEHEVTSETAILRYHYSWGDTQVTRTVEVVTEPKVAVSYELSREIDQFQLMVKVAPEMTIKSYNIEGGKVDIVLHDPYGRVADTNIELLLLETDGELEEVKFVAGEGANQASGFRFNITGPESFARFRVTIKDEPAQSTIHFYDGVELIRDNVDYILVNKADHAELRGLYRDAYRFEYDPRFEKVFENEEVLIFFVHPPPAAGRHMPLPIHYKNLYHEKRLPAIIQTLPPFFSTGVISFIP